MMTLQRRGFALVFQHIGPAFSLLVTYPKLCYELETS